MLDSDDVESSSLASRFFRSPTVDATSAPSTHNLDNVVGGSAEMQPHVHEERTDYQSNSSNLTKSSTTGSLSASLSTSEAELGSQLPLPPPLLQTATPLSEEEHRIDPIDGFYYPKSAFISMYGGTKEWDAALVQPSNVVEEFRVDPSDGLAYAKQDWIDLYGGTLEWDKAQAPSVGTRRASRAMSIVGTLPKLTEMHQIDECSAAPQNQQPPQPAATEADSPSEELRIDPNDGFNYPKKDFLAFYGGTKEWDAARVQPANKVEELRVDPSDGCAYTKEDFVALYGGTLEWDKAVSPSLSTRRASRMEEQPVASLPPISLFGSGSDGHEEPKALSGSMSSPETEHRIDPNDGAYYPKEDFIAFYGGTVEWENAHVQPAHEVEEFRVDPSDGCAYAKKDFIALYGGTVEWDACAASPQRARRASRIESPSEALPQESQSTNSMKEASLPPVSEEVDVVDEPEGHQESRIDPHDGFAYSKSDFVLKYGGDNEWNSAVPPPKVEKTETEVLLFNELQDVLPKRRSSIGSKDYEDILARTKAQYDLQHPPSPTGLEKLISSMSEVNLRDHRLKHPAARQEEAPHSPGSSVLSPLGSDGTALDYRLDPYDGYAYSFEDFVKKYGGTNEWDSATSAFGDVGEWDETKTAPEASAEKTAPEASAEEPAPEANAEEPASEANAEEPVVEASAEELAPETNAASEPSPPSPPTANSTSPFEDTAANHNGYARRIQRVFRGWSAAQWQQFELGQAKATTIQAALRACIARRQWRAYRNALWVFAMRFRRKMRRMENSRRPLMEQKLTFKLHNVRGSFEMRAMHCSTDATTLRLSWEDPVEPKKNSADLGRELRPVEADSSRFSEIREVELARTPSKGRLSVVSSDGRLWVIETTNKVTCSMLMFGLQSWAKSLPPHQSQYLAGVSERGISV